MEKVKLEFNQQQMQIINTALAELPYRVVEPVFSYIRSEIDNQLKEATAGDSAPRGPSVKIDGKDVPLSENGTQDQNNPGVTTGILKKGSDGQGDIVVGMQIS